MSTAAPLQNTAAKSRQCSNSSNAGLLVQRKCACGGSAGLGGHCEECQTKKLIGLQTKLAVSEPGDIYEQEADRIADQLMATPAHPAVNGAPPRIQRFSGQSNGQMDAAPACVDQALASPGRPLEPTLRQDMEQRFGHDFSCVRVHDDGAADRSARSLDARVYTVRDHVVFGRGEYRPGAAQGDRLLAHELTHVVQQSRTGAGIVQRSPRTTSDLSKSAESKPKERRKVLKEKVYVDQDRIVYEFDTGPNEERKVIQWNARDPLPGVYHFKEKGKHDEWRPAPEWVQKRNLKDQNDSRVWMVDDPIPWEINDEFQIEIIGGAKGKEVHSFRETYAAMSAEMQEVLFPKPGLLVHDNTVPIKTAQDEYAVYQIIKEIERYSITPEELFAYQKQHPDARRANNIAEMQSEAYRVIAEIQRQRLDQGLEQAHYINATEDLEGDKAAYMAAMKRVRDFGLRIYFPELAASYRAAGDLATARLFARIDDFVRQFEKQTVMIGSQLLNTLELQIRMDLRYLSGLNMPARQKAQWRQMRTHLTDARGQIAPTYKKADEFAEQTVQKSLELQTVDQSIPAYASQRRAELQKEIEAISAAEKSANEEAATQVAAALPELRVASKFKDFPSRKVLNASDDDELSHRVLRFLFDKIVVVNTAGEKLRAEPEWIYKLDILLTHAQKELKIEPGSIYEMIIKHRASDVAKRDAWIDELLTLLSIALMFIPGAGVMAAGVVDTALLGRAVASYHEGQLGFQASLKSTEPSSLAVWFAMLGFGSSVASIFGSSGKALRPPEGLSHLGQTATTDLKASQSLAKAGEESADVARRDATHTESTAARTESETARTADVVEKGPAPSGHEAKTPASKQAQPDDPSARVAGEPAQQGKPAPDSPADVMNRTDGEIERLAALRAREEFRAPRPNETPEQWAERTTWGWENLPEPARRMHVRDAPSNMRRASIVLSLRDPNTRFQHYLTGGGYEEIMRRSSLRSGGGTGNWGAGESVRAHPVVKLPGLPTRTYVDFVVPNPPVKPNVVSYMAGDYVAWSMPARDHLSVMIVRVRYTNGAVATPLPFAAGPKWQLTFGKSKKLLTLEDLLKLGETPTLP